jgi:hypothetical protein
MQGHGIMNSGFYASFVQPAPYSISVFYSDNKEVEIVLSARWNLRNLEAPMAEPRGIRLGVLDTVRIPYPKVTKFDAKHSRLERIQSRVCADNEMNVLRRATVVSQQSKPVGMHWIIAGDRAGVAVCAKVLAGIKAETGEPARSTGRYAVPLSPMRLCCVFDHDEPVPISQFLES